MNTIIKNIFIAFSLCLLISSCDQLDLDMRVSPNDLAADASDPNLLLNSIQLAFAGNQVTLNNFSAQLTRIDYFFGRDYFNNIPSSDLDAVWRRTYSSDLTVLGDSDAIGASVGILTNLQALEELNASGTLDLSFHVGVGQTLYAYSLLQLVDFVGQAAFSEAGNSAEIPSPTLDDGASVYASALALLTEAETALSSNPSTVGVQDFFYGANPDAWIRLINTIRLRSFVLMQDQASFDEIIAGGNFISSSADDLQLNFGTSELQPDNRHPDYASDYTTAGADLYRNNWIMNLMLENNDFRRRYYFYRQESAVPGAIGVDGTETDPNEEQLNCSLIIPPPHFAGNVFCSGNSGYWGRSHGNDDGIPPDGFQRTASGVYPAGGRFDDNSFGVVGLGVGGGGAGIEPMILSSYVDFWQGIMADSDAERAGFLRSGLEKSFAKVMTFASLDADADFTFEPSEDQVTDYIDRIVEEFNSSSGDDRENVFAEQYFTTLYGGAFEAYNYYRLTGYPTTLAPNVEPDPGAFPRSYLIPQTEVINNPNVSQKTDLITQVFWDTNPPSPAFPPAN